MLHGVVLNQAQGSLNVLIVVTIPTTTGLPEPNSATLKIEAVRSSETLDQNSYTSRCEISDDHLLIGISS
jgi:hypothetical protein